MPANKITPVDAEHAKRLKYHREYRRAHPGKLAKASRLWRERNPERNREAIIRGEANRNIEKRRNGARRRYAANSEFRQKQLTYLHKWRKKYPEKVKAAKDNWAKRNKSKVKAIKSARNNRIRKLGGTITAAEVLALYKYQRGRCAACGKMLRMKYHLDHIMPIALGGRHEIRNAQILCPPCNLAKGAVHPRLWMSRVK